MLSSPVQNQQKLQDPLTPSEVETNPGGNSTNYSDQLLQSNSDAWVGFLTQNVSITRVDSKPFPEYKAEDNLENQKKIEEYKRFFEQNSPQKAESVFSAKGEIVFKWNESHPSEAKTTPLKIEKPSAPKPERKIDLIKPLQQTITEIMKPLNFVFSISKGLIMDGIFSVIKENSQRVLTPEEKQAKAEREKKEKAKAANKKGFFDALSQGSIIFNQQKQKERVENRQRLGILELDVFALNKFLSGENSQMRNLSNRQIEFDYHDEYAAIALVEKRRMDRQREAQKTAALASPKKAKTRGPNLIMEMDKQHLSKGGTVTSAGG